MRVLGTVATRLGVLVLNSWQVGEGRGKHYLPTPLLNALWCLARLDGPVSHGVIWSRGRRS